jgi:NADPH-dependent 2,4-dienoyl-CoA reductase/sulfur reductase-like enzyme
MPRRYLIVGLGAAGVAAGEAVRHLDPAGEILLISDDPHGYYSRPGLAYYLTGELAKSWLPPFSEADFRRLDLRRLQARAVELHPQAQEVELEDGRRLAYDRLLLATGSRAVAAPMPGADLDGVVKLDNMADADGIVRRCRHARSAVVVGGGITALELAEGLHARKVRTHYLLRHDRYWPGVLDEIESRIVEDRLHKEGIRILHGTEIAEILGQKGKVRGVVTKDGGQIACELVAVAVGVRPRVELASAAGLRVDRGILVDEYLQASAPGILAAGDVAQAFDPATGRAVLDTLWGIAVGQGRAAGRIMAGQAVPYRKPVPFNVTRLAGLTTTIIGTVGRGGDGDLLAIARGDSESWRHHPGVPAAQDSFEVNRVRVMVGQAALLGAIVMGDQTLSRPLQELITRQADISPVRAELLRPGASLGELIGRFWSEGSWRDAAS